MPGGNYIVHAPVVDGDQRPAALQRLDKLRAVDGVDEDDQVGVVLAGVLGKGLNAQLLGEDCVRRGPRQLGKFVAQRLDDQVFGLLIDGRGNVQLGLLDMRVFDPALEGGQILLAHPAAHMVHRLQDDLPAIAQNQVIQRQFFHSHLTAPDHS